MTLLLIFGLYLLAGFVLGFLLRLVWAWNVLFGMLFGFIILIGLIALYLPFQALLTSAGGLFIAGGPIAILLGVASAKWRGH